MTKTLTVGSWSEGSTRDEDIGSAVLSMAEELHRAGIDVLESEPLQALADSLDHLEDDHECDRDECPSEYIGFAISEAIDAVQEFAPVYCYVGMVEGDGANFGVWPDHDAIREATRNADSTRDGSDVTYINAEDGVRIHINDHGNMEVYSLESGESLLALV